MKDDWIDGAPPPPPMGFAARWAEYTPADDEQLEEYGHLVEIAEDCKCGACKRARGE